MTTVKLSLDDEEVITTLPDDVNIQKGDYIRVGEKQYEVRCEEYVKETGERFVYVDEVSQSLTDTALIVIAVFTIAFAVLGVGFLISLFFGF